MAHKFGPMLSAAKAWRHQLHAGHAMQKALVQQVCTEPDQARLSQLELQPGRLTVERLLLILAALDLELVVRPRQGAIETAEW